MRVTIFLAIAILAYACGATSVNAPSKISQSDTLKIYAEYFSDTIWGISIKSIAWRIVKDTILIDGETVRHTRDSIYYVPQQRKLVDSLSRPIKTKDGKADSLVVLPVLLPRIFLQKDYGSYHKYLYGY